MIDLIHIGEIIKQLRDDNHQTQSDFSNNIGMSHSYLSQIENGKRMPSIYMLNRICDELGCELDIDITKKDHDKSVQEKRLSQFYSLCSPDSKIILLKLAEELAKNSHK